jgi:ABC-type uncharacterized transport system substrate-binding protein
MLTIYETICLRYNDDKNTVVMQIAAYVMGQVYFTFLRKDLEKVGFDKAPTALKCHQTQSC